jgi:uncharacterized protein
MQHSVKPKHLHTILNQLHDPAVRDLAWTIAAPSLLDPEFPAYQGKVVSDAWCASALENCHDWLLHLDQHPAKLHQLIEKRATRRLGYYFETLIEFWLAHASGIQLLAHNLPVKDKLITIGEFDFLLRDPQGNTFHWETAIKFYLQDEASFEQHHFIGPGGYDRLDLKLDKIFSHQLQLAHSPACHVKVDTNMAFVKGMLYYHPAATPTRPPPGISPAHLRGWWVRHQADAIPQTSSDSRWIILSRLNWLAPAFLPSGANVMTRTELEQKVQENFQARNNALLLVELAQKPDGYWQEIARGFVVTTIWPKTD